MIVCETFWVRILFFENSRLRRWISFAFGSLIKLLITISLFCSSIKFTAPKAYKSSSDYVTGLYNPEMASRCVKKDAGTSMHREQCLDLTEK